MIGIWVFYHQFHYEIIFYLPSSEVLVCLLTKSIHLPLISIHVFSPKRFSNFLVRKFIFKKSCARFGCCLLIVRYIENMQEDAYGRVCVERSDRFLGYILCNLITEQRPESTCLMSMISKFIIMIESHTPKKGHVYVSLSLFLTYP